MSGTPSFLAVLSEEKIMWEAGLNALVRRSLMCDSPHRPPSHLSVPVCAVLRPNVNVFLRTLFLVILQEISSDKSN